MKKILLTSYIVSALLLSGASFVSAQYIPYYNTYQNAPTSNSYTYTQGCYIYQYDRYTQITSLVGSTCQVQQQPTYTYPTYQTTYTYPIYQTQSYIPSTYYFSNGSWYQSNQSYGNYYNSANYNNDYYHRNYRPQNPCTEYTGYYRCY